MWFIASVVWATYMNMLKSEFNGHLAGDPVALVGCGGDTSLVAAYVSGGSLVQAAIAVVIS